MSVEVYSKCRVQLSSTNDKNIDYDRCIVELRQYDVGDYALRIVDLNNPGSVRMNIFFCGQLTNYNLKIYRRF